MSKESDYRTFDSVSGAPQLNPHVTQQQLPASCTREVVNKALALASRVALKGTGEKTPAKGFLLIIGDSQSLMDGSYGTYSNTTNMFEAKDMSVMGILDHGKEDILTYTLPAFGMDKAMVICGRTGRILANMWSVSDISKGISGAGCKLQAASAMAQNGFFTLKCSEDSCGFDGTPHGDFNIFNGTKDYVSISVAEKKVTDKPHTTGDRIIPVFETVLSAGADKSASTNMLLAAGSYKIALKNIGHAIQCYPTALVTCDGARLNWSTRPGSGASHPFTIRSGNAKIVIKVTGNNDTFIPVGDCQCEVEVTKA